jgi:periplasmic protein TonB
MTESFLRVTAVIAVLVVPLTSCSSERARKEADRDSLRAEVMTLVEQSPERRQANVCDALTRNDRFDGPDDPQRTACATWTELTPTARQVFMDSIVQQKPEMLSHPPLRYPEQLRQAGIEGRVVVRLIVDATGQVEPTAVKIIKSANPGFNEAAKRMILGARYRPGEVHGHATRVVLDQPIDFKIAR